MKAIVFPYLYFLLIVLFFIGCTEREPIDCPELLLEPMKNVRFGQDALGVKDWDLELRRIDTVLLPFSNSPTYSFIYNILSDSIINKPHLFSLDSSNIEQMPLNLGDFLKVRMDMLNSGILSVFQKHDIQPDDSKPYYNRINNNFGNIELKKLQKEDIYNDSPKIKKTKAQLASIFTEIAIRELSEKPSDSFDEDDGPLADYLACRNPSDWKTELKQKLTPFLGPSLSILFAKNFYLSSIIIGVLLLTLFFFMFEFIRRFSKKKDNSNKEGSSPATENTNSEEDAISNHPLIIRILENQKKLEKKVDELFELLQKNNSSSEKNTITPATDAEIIAQKQTLKQTTLPSTYFSAPPRQTLFLTNKLSSKFIPKEHLYIIKVLDNDNASFDLVDDPESRKIGLKMSDNFLLNAVKVVGEGDLVNAKVIWTTPGHLKKDGLNWRIVDKIILNFS